MRVSPLTRRIASLLVSAFASLGLASSVAGATFAVTRTDDPAPNGCLPGDCSVREAVVAANSAPGSIINIPAGTYTLTIPGADNSTSLASIGDLDLLVPMTISGAGAGTILQATGIHRVIDNHATTNVNIVNLVVRNGTDVESSSGGCIRNTGVLTLDGVTVGPNCTSAVGGGGIASYNTLTVVRSTITGNTVSGTGASVVSGGGIAGGPGPARGVNSTVNIAQSVISNNTAAHSTNGDLRALGGGFANTAVMNITNTTITGNVALNVGGGINTGTSILSEVTVSNNRARFDVGGVDNDNIMTINNSTFSGNQAGFGCVGTECNRAFAGGVLNTDNGQMFVNNTTFSGNTCLISGGGLLNALGTTTISSSTFVGNTCGLGAGFSASDVTFLKNTIVTNNTATNPAGGDCSGGATTVQSQGYNMIQNTTGCAIGGTATGNIIGQSANVGPLQNNGGPTQTRALNAASPARNAGNPAGCLNHASALLQGDQRGFAKPQEGRCDIGAFEFGVEAIIVHRLRHPSIGAYLFTVSPTERDTAQWQFGYVYEGVCCNWLTSSASDGRTNLYRLYSGSAGEYFFTISPGERDSAVANFGYLFEGTSAFCYATQVANTRPWYRLRFGNKHLYTIYPEERDSAIGLGYVLEGTACFLPSP